MRMTFVKQWKYGGGMFGHPIGELRPSPLAKTRPPTNGAENHPVNRTRWLPFQLLFIVFPMLQSRMNGQSSISSLHPRFQGQGHTQWVPGSICHHLFPPTIHFKIKPHVNKTVKVSMTTWSLAMIILARPRRALVLRIV